MVAGSAVVDMAVTVVVARTVAEKTAVAADEAREAEAGRYSL